MKGDTQEDEGEDETYNKTQFNERMEERLPQEGLRGKSQQPDRTFHSFEAS